MPGRSGFLRSSERRYVSIGDYRVIYARTREGYLVLRIGHLGILTTTGIALLANVARLPSEFAAPSFSNQILSGKIRELHPLMLAIAAAFAAYFLWGAT